MLPRSLSPRSLSLAGLLTLILPALTWAHDWPQWRGPNRDGISQETGLLRQWPQGGPELLWQVTDVGSGFGTPSVVGDRIYLIGNEGMTDEFVQARNMKDGSLVWQTRIGRVGKNSRPHHPGARSTPTVDGEHLYVLGSNGDLGCLKRADGAIVWQKNLKQDFGGKPGNWAYAASPLIDGDLLVCTPGGKDATILALNKQTGEVVWKCPLGEEAAYASIVTINVDGQKQYVQLLAKGVVGVDAKTGELLWRYDHTAKGSMANIATPVVKNNLVYTSTGRGGSGVVAIKPHQKDFVADELYHSMKLPDNIGGSVLHEGRLFGTTRQGLMCVDFNTGEILWKARSIGPASILFADGLLILHGENGVVALVEAAADGYHELGRFTPPDAPDPGRERTWAYPVLSDGKLYIRQGNALWCFDVAQ